MGIFERLRWSASILTEPVSELAPTFAVDEAAIDPAVFGLTSYATPTAPAPRVDRRTAIQVPAVKRVRDLVAGTLGTLPLELFGPDRQRVASTLLEQPERHVPRSVTMTRTFEDLLFEGVAWWLVVEFGWHTYPVRAERVAPARVTVADKPRECPAAVAGCSGAVSIDGKHKHDTELIRFDSPNDALLVAGARAIRTCLSLDAAVARYADEPVPTGWFTPTDSAIEPSPEEQTKLLDDWHTARQRRATAYVPAALDYKSAAFSPEALQLADQRRGAVLEIARLGGVDAEEVGVAVTSRVYNNAFDRRKQFTDFTLGAYRAAVQDRLSMGDVTPRGYTARFDLDEFLRSDPQSWYGAIRAGLDVGAILPGEVRALDGKAPDPSGQLPARTPQETRVSATDAPPAATFAAGPAIRLDAPGAAAFEVDVEARTIRGLAVPYGIPARSGGKAWQFSQGSLELPTDPSRIKLWLQHDATSAVGYAAELDDREDGLYPVFKIARGADGDRALQLAEDRVWDGLSIGLADGGKFEAREGVNHAVSAPLMEISLTPAPAFDDARVHSVAASAVHERETIMTEAPTLETTGAADFSALGSTITDAIAAGFADLRTPQAGPAGRETVNAGGAVVTRDELPYRFTGGPGEFSLVDDLRALASGNSEAAARLDVFMAEAGEAFAVTTGNVATLNPTQTRPELYVPNLTYTTPLQSAISTGSIDDKTPFTVPKFATATGLVGPHVEGVEPTPGAFTATSQTVTPTALSGKIEINREVWDQGGSPQADTIIWGEMLNAWQEAREARIATLLNGLSLTEINLASAVDDALVTALSNIVVDLQFVRGGNRYTSAVADGMLFKALVNAKATDGRKLLPVMGPTNAQGTVSPGFSAVQLGNLSFEAAWALGATNTSNSYLLVPTSVWQWASAPRKFTFEYQVKSIDMAIWGYEGNACLRDTDVKRIDYTAADV